MKLIGEWLDSQSLGRTPDNIKWAMLVLKVPVYIIKTISGMSILTTQKITDYKKEIELGECLVDGETWSESVALNPVHVVCCVEWLGRRAYD